MITSPRTGRRSLLAGSAAAGAVGLLPAALGGAVEGNAIHAASRSTRCLQESLYQGTRCMTQLTRLPCTGRIRTTCGRDSAPRSSDVCLDAKLSKSGTKGSGTNPGQLLAAGWPACPEDAMGPKSREMKVVPPADAAIGAEVDLNTSESPYPVRDRLDVSLPGLERGAARRLTKAGHRTCPYSKATRGYVAVAIILV